MENLTQLGKICQKPEYKTRGNWMARNITRDMALPVSWVFLHTPVTANQVTLLSLVVGLAACLLFCAGTKGAMLGGALMLQLWYLLDHVDGHIARYRNQTSTTGVYFDYITHYVIHAGVFAGLGIGAARITGNSTFATCGWVASLAIVMFMLVYDCMYKAFYARLVKSEGTIKVNAPGHGRGEDKDGKRAAPLKLLYSLVHRSCEIHVVMNTVTAFAVVSFFTGMFPWGWLVCYYAAAAVLIAAVKNVFFVIKKLPDAEYGNTFREV